jgi:deoxyribodipyrimidine photo-lyase
MNKPASIVWFGLDLRLADNPALNAAVSAGGPVIPAFIWAPDEESPWAPGAASRWWLHQSLGALGASLRARGSRLILRRGPTLETLRVLMNQTGADCVFFNRRYEPALIARDKMIESALTTRAFKSALLFEPAELKPYRVFTPFWKACLARQEEIGAAEAAPSKFPAPAKWPPSLQLEELRLLPKTNWAAGFGEVWQPGEAGARRQLLRFRRAALTGYPGARNRPDMAGTSRLSPHLHFGEVSPRQVWRATTGQEAYRRQLIWREFAHHLLFHFPHTAAAPLRPEFENFPWRRDESALRAWQRGRTGYWLVDAGMRQLWATGWMHNRARMIAASFLVKDLLISWQEGARWFWDTLVDADLANNTLGWQWAAGCGADAVPFFRIFNPVIQAAKFDPDSAYARRWIPELGTTDYPPPIVNHAEARRRALLALARMRARRHVSGKERR